VSRGSFRVNSAVTVFNFFVRRKEYSVVARLVPGELGGRGGSGSLVAAPEANGALERVLNGAVAADALLARGAGLEECR
jgi:hypothetical protein